jgi:alkanesulfonate monooxygenase SsuD/methylene tetrahydromethanopterin reductase-like flavin-dependent oxidoreductase (luciferase family)
MDVSIALPNAVPGATGEQLTEWARRAEARGFRSLGTIDRIVFDNYEPLVALAAAAAVTERIGLCTSVLLAPLRANAVEMGKQALSVHALSGGRLTLGVGLGAREDDYEASGVPTDGKGARMDAALEAVRRAWDDDRIGPGLAGAPRLIVGGHADASFRRAARLGDGWIAAGSGPDQFRQGGEEAKEAWRAAGRDDDPHLMALAYFALGENAAGDAQAYLSDYYAWLGDEAVGMIVSGAATDSDAVGDQLAKYEEGGCDELVFCPSSSDPEQVDLLADAAGL